MANFKPFKALRPKSELAHVISDQPYDVMSLDEAKTTIKNNPLSILNITRPDSLISSDEKLANQSEYSVAKDMFNQFKSKGLLIEDSQQSYFIYSQQMGEHVQYGIVGLCSVDDYWNNVIKKHEHTRPKKEKDRMNHIQSLKAHLGPILMTYKYQDSIDDLVKTITSAEPEISFNSNDGITHKIWAVTNMTTINQFKKEFENIESIYIADGHHRTAAASNIGKNKPDSNESYFLSVLFPDNQLKILAYNRIVKDVTKSSSEILDKLSINFSIEKVAKSSPENPKSFTFYIENQWYLLSLKESSTLKGIINNLDVSILQDLILTPILNIGDPRTDEKLDFIGGIKGLDELEKKAKEFKGVAFSLYPTQLHELFNIADSGMVMPPKSTWFEPKLRSGLFISQF